MMDLLFKTIIGPIVVSIILRLVDKWLNATVSFMTQKMTIEADDARFDDIMKEVVSVCKKVEPDCVILM